jgi:hypothetical protein
MRRVLVFAGLGGALAGCAVAGFGKGPPSTGSVALTESRVPWQFAPGIGFASASHDTPRFSLVEGRGLVLATPRVLASFPNELRSRAEPNRTLAECKRQIELGAARYGKASVEAASLGPERRIGREVYEGTVEVRVLYDFRLYYEVRQATLTCYSRADGSILDLRVVSPINSGDASGV